MSGLRCRLALALALLASCTGSTGVGYESLTDRLADAVSFDEGTREDGAAPQSNEGQYTGSVSSVNVLGTVLPGQSFHLLLAADGVDETVATRARLGFQDSRRQHFAIDIDTRLWTDDGGYVLLSGRLTSNIDGAEELRGQSFGMTVGLENADGDVGAYRAFTLTVAAPSADAEICGNGIDEDGDGQDEYCDPPAGVALARGTAVFRYEAAAAGTGAAVSEADRLPWTNLSRSEAEAACLAAGYRLCRWEELALVCRGPAGNRYPYGDDLADGTCNLDTGALQDTGLAAGCATPEGVQDLVGNAAEWVVFGDDLTATYGGDASAPASTSCGAASVAAPGERHPLTGFRCCAAWDDDLDGDGVVHSMDCHDGEPSVWSAGDGEEICNGIDDDCDGVVDPEESTGCTVYYQDADDDGLGLEHDSRCLCAPEGDHDATTAGDCDDGNPAVLGCTTWYRDADDDGLGVEGDARCLCGPEGEYRVTVAGDCDDNNQGVLGCTTWYRDADDDGLGVEGDTRCLCGPEGEYRASAPGDCDDGAAAVLGCVDHYLDADGDGFGIGAPSCLCEPDGEIRALQPGDCNDEDPLVFPGAQPGCVGQCSDGVPDAGEDCDDGNAVLWDGCNGCLVPQLLEGALGGIQDLTGLDVEIGDLTVPPYDGSDGTGEVVIQARNILVAGTIDVSARGYGGGGGGGGGAGTAGGCSDYADGGSGGDGVAGGASGGRGQDPCDKVAVSGAGGDGGGPAAGAGADQASCSGNPADGVVGHPGGDGGYALPGLNGDESTDASVTMGSGGGGASGGSGACAERWNNGAGGGGGGGAGARGGGAVSLVATGTLTVSGAILARGSTSAGNGRNGGYTCTSWTCDYAGDGGRGGHAASDGERAGGTNACWNCPENRECNGRDAKCYWGGTGGTGGTGAGGGVLLLGQRVIVDGDIDAHGGLGETNGGTVKIIYLLDHQVNGTIQAGRQLVREGP